MLYKSRLHLPLILKLSISAPMYTAKFMVAIIVNKSIMLVC